jgi:methionyl-tRNA synthetase
MAVKKEVCDKGLKARRVKGAYKLVAGSHPKITEQSNVQFRLHEFAKNLSADLTADRENAEQVCYHCRQL